MNWAGRKSGRDVFNLGGSHRLTALCAFHGKTGSEGHSERGAAMVIRARAEPASVLAERFGTTEQSTYKLFARMPADVRMR